MALVDKIGAIGRHQLVVFDDASCLPSKVKERYDGYSALYLAMKYYYCPNFLNLTDTLIL